MPLAPTVNLNLRLDYDLYQRAMEWLAQQDGEKQSMTSFLNDAAREKLERESKEQR
jgi:hypothetical protein